MKKLFFLSLLILAIVSCQNNGEFAKLGDSFVPSTPDKAQFAVTAAENFISSLPLATRGGDKEVGDVYAWRTADLFPTTRSTEHAALPDTLLYIVNFKDSEGFVLVHSQDSVGGILAYIESGHLTPTDDIEEDSGFRAFLDRLQYGDPLPNEPIDTSLVKPFEPLDTVPIDLGRYYWRIDSILPQLIQTQWGQRAPFNTYCHTPYGQQAPAGCVPVALAQTFAYHQYPSGYNGHAYLWSDILSGSTPSTSSGQTSVAHLVHDIGILAGTSYGVNGSGTTDSGKANCLNALGYHYSYGAYSYNTCMQEFTYGRPVVIGGYDIQAGYYRGHCWVVDGAIIRGRYYAASKQHHVDDPYPRVGEQLLIHCNWGNNGNYDGYFLSNNFELNARVLDNSLEDNTQNASTNYIFNTDVSMFYEIYPVE